MAPVQSKIMATTKSEASIEAGRNTKSSRQLPGTGYHKNVSSTHHPNRHSGMHTLQGVKPMGSYQRDSITEGGQERYPCYYREWLECLETFTTLGNATNHSKLHLHTVADGIFTCPHAKVPPTTTTTVGNFEGHPEPALSGGCFIVNVIFTLLLWTILSFAVNRWAIKME
ncbi:hypothetical protein BGZ57DRAFT_925178 [Hyaloscypha finlandica]|nr:hypothetical protein BGZ57DRAFT_925178 [Hyaloscypha finlandica]